MENSGKVLAVVPTKAKCQELHVYMYVYIYIYHLIDEVRTWIDWTVIFVVF